MVSEIEMAAVELSEQLVRPAAVFLEDNPADVVRHMPQGVIIDLDVISIPHHIFGGLVGTLVL